MNSFVGRYIEGGGLMIKTVLVVEEDHFVRELIVRMLKRGGSFRVLQTCDPEGAFCAVRYSVVDLVISGMEIPGVRFLSPVIYTSTEVEHLDRGTLEEGEYFLQKPFTTDQLLLKITEVK